MKLELGVCAWDSRPHPKGIHNPGARSERDFDCKDWVSGFVAEKLTDLELSPCPFCGSTDLELDNIRQEDDFFVSCNNCEVQQIANYTRLEAVRRWNMRPVYLKAAEAPGGQDAAPVMRCSKCKGTLIYKRTDEGFVIFEDSCGRKAIAPAAPSERADEREKFERVAEVYGWSATLYGTERIRENYLDYTLQRRWEGWQARAGLSSQEGK